MWLMISSITFVSFLSGKYQFSKSVMEGLLNKIIFVDSANTEPEEEDIEHQIRDRGLLNVLKVNVGNRRRIVKSVPIVQKSALFLFSPKNR